MRTALSSTTLALALALPAAAQSLPEGYAGRIRALAPGTSHVLALTGSRAGALVAFDGTRLTLHSSGAPQPLLTLPAPAFGSFVIEVDATRVLLGESSTGDLWLVPLSGPAPTQPLVNIPFNYDAVMLTPSHAVVSAKTSGFSGPDNDLVLLDVSTGAVQLLATIPGASGPVATDGDLYYATASLAYPTPPGQTAILRFARATVLQAMSNQLVLGPGQAQVLYAGLDSAADLALDDDGDLLFVDWYQNALGEIDDLDGPAPSRKNLIDYGSASHAPTSVQFVPSPGAAVFEPFQLQGGSLHVHETDYLGADRIRTVLAASATLAVNGGGPVAAGPFSLAVAGGPVHGHCLIAFALANGGGVGPVSVAGFEQPLSWHVSLLVPTAAHLVTLDASGAANLGLLNPGFSPAIAVVSQAAFLDANGTVIGATPPRLLTLGP